MATERGLLKTPNAETRKVSIQRSLEALQLRRAKSPIRIASFQRMWSTLAAILQFHVEQMSPSDTKLLRK